MARSREQDQAGWDKHHAREQKRTDRHFAELRAAREESDEEPESETERQQMELDEDDDEAEKMQLDEDTDNNEEDEEEDEDDEDDEDDELPSRAQVSQERSRRRNRALENTAKHGGPAIPPRNALSNVVRPTAPSNPPKTATPATRLTRASRGANGHAHFSLGDRGNLKIHEDGVCVYSLFPELPLAPDQPKLAPGSRSLSLILFLRKKKTGGLAHNVRHAKRGEIKFHRNIKRDEPRIGWDAVYNIDLKLPGKVLFSAHGPAARQHCRIFEQLLSLRD
ncbi:uncharacterized protein MYCGRDRAFT_94907 [Zymoseptoria tritici IPO323]|uniref:Uncharacterized protein n=1 Tax=Zymoseptoria tritici (strain CBS 115943 / IPO323) TaxID=336722 RepID=F9XI21_ZYMTI|nr:uncharacterized protein MYCGRDRAFT_94907 [Zymoseptoria tritici IPO323]EGP84865.1 hypothetical protein MYCGRDRAFT_94907 [Zymoseptoria tritici IPO323]